MFSTSENLRQLCASTLISMDGTFSVVPRLFGQLSTIHGFQDTVLLPLVYVLMVNKTAGLYATVFQDLKAQCQQVCLTMVIE